MACMMFTMRITPTPMGSAGRAPVVVSPENTAHMFTYCSQLSIYSMHLLTALAQQPQNRAAPWRVSPQPYAIRHTPYAVELFIFTRFLKGFGLLIRF